MALPSPRTLLGVINISPESMVSDSVVAGEEQLLERAAWLSAHGCGILDLGARSITPTAAMIDDAEEQRRLLPPAPPAPGGVPDLGRHLELRHRAGGPGGRRHRHQLHRR